MEMLGVGVGGGAGAARQRGRRRGGGRGWDLSHEEQLALARRFWPICKASLDFANMQREGVVLASFAKKLVWGPVIQMLLELVFLPQFV